MRTSWSSHQAFFLMYYPKKAITGPAFLKAYSLYDGESLQSYPVLLM